MGENIVFNYICPTHNCAFNWNNELKKIIEYTMPVVLNQKYILDSSSGLIYRFPVPHSEIQILPFGNKAIE